MVHGNLRSWYTSQKPTPNGGILAEASGSRNTLRHADSIVSTSYEVPGSPEMPECPGFGTSCTKPVRRGPGAERRRRRGYRHEALCAAMEFRVAIDAIAAGDLWVIGRVARG